MSQPIDRSGLTDSPDWLQRLIVNTAQYAADIAYGNPAADFLTDAHNSLIPELVSALKEAQATNERLRTRELDTAGILRSAGNWIADQIREDDSGEPWTCTRTLLNSLIGRVDEIASEARS